MILKFLILLTATTSILFSTNCQEESSQESILAIQKDKSLDLRTAVSKILPLVFPNLLKEWSLEQDSKTKNWILVVSYGGSTALTFSSQKEYLENTVNSQALYNARLVAAISDLPLQEIKLSLTKPLYVKGENHPDAGIQEFEIFRTSVSVEKMKGILFESGNTNLFSDVKKQKTDLARLFEQIQKISLIELNQLHRITVE
jgi:hypothetical protein